MEPHVPEKLSLDFSSSVKLKLLRVYKLLGQMAGKCIYFSSGFPFFCNTAYFIFSAPVGSCTFAVSVIEPAATWTLQERLVVICEGFYSVVCRESTKLLQCPPSKLGMPKQGRGTEGRSVHP